MADIYVARTTGVVIIDGRRYTLHKGRTRVRAGHPILDEGRENMFELLSVDYDVEQATAAPGEKRDVSPAPRGRRRSGEGATEVRG